MSADAFRDPHDRTDYFAAEPLTPEATLARAQRARLVAARRLVAAKGAMTTAQGDRQVVGLVAEVDATPGLLAAVETAVTFLGGSVVRGPLLEAGDPRDTPPRYYVIPEGFQERLQTANTDLARAHQQVAYWRHAVVEAENPGRLVMDFGDGPRVLTDAEVAERFPEGVPAEGVHTRPSGW